MAFATTTAGREYREEARVAIREAKSAPCLDCGHSYPYYVMDLDHRPDEIKSHVVNRMPGRFGLKKVLAEIAKCDAVCSNCHRIRTYARHSALLVEQVDTAVLNTAA